MARIVTLLIFTFMVYGCQSDTAYKERENDFENNRWPKDRVLEFRFDIEEAGPHRIDFLMRHAHGFQFAQVPVTARMELPDGMISRSAAVLEFYDQDKKPKGDCLGDYCDFEQPLFHHIDLPAGTYILTVSHEFNHEYLPNVVSAGISVTILKP